MSAATELVRRLEAATQGSVELDQAIYAHFLITTDDPSPLTRSVEHALALHPYPLKVKMTRRADRRGYACVWRYDGVRSAHAATLPLALCIVALKP